MIKAMAMTEKGPLIVLGITDANVERMKGDDPIVFNLRDIHLPARWVCVSCKHDDGMAAFPAGLTDFIGLVFMPHVFDRMEKGPVDVEADQYHFVLVRASDESTLALSMRELIGPLTTVYATT